MAKSPAERSFTLCARVVEWQTRQLEVLVPARACGFDSHLEYHF
jgi:hypothetical protein